MRIEIKNLQKNYKEFQLKNVSFTLESGKAVGIIGENGAGKTTTMKILSGLANFDDGEILVNDKPLNSLSMIEKQKLAFVFDEPMFPPRTKVSRLEKIISGLFVDWNKESFEGALRDYGIDPNKKIGALSLGMKAKLNLAIAMSHKAEALILDEPANGLDALSRDELLLKLAEFRNNGGAVLISSHILTELSKLCDSFVLLHHGEVLLFENKEDLLREYKLVSVSEEKYLPTERLVSYRADPLTGTIKALYKGEIPNGQGLLLLPPSLEDIFLLLMKDKR